MACILCTHTHICITVRVRAFISHSILLVYVFDEIAAAAHDNNIFVNVIACELVHLQSG